MLGRFKCFEDRPLEDEDEEVEAVLWLVGELAFGGVVLPLLLLVFVLF